MKKKDFISKLLEVGAVISFTALISVVFLQVFARFLLPKTPSWTEEASRFLFIYSVAFAAPLALKRDEYVKVDILFNKFSESIKRKLNNGLYLILSLFFLLIAAYGLIFAKLGLIQTSPAMGLPMFIPYGSIAMSCFFMFFYAFKKFINCIKRKEKSLKEEKEVAKEWK